MIGTQLGHYEITAHLGSGGMGDVYQAADTKLGRNVAVKFLPEAFSHDIERVARFRREARVLASLNHSNIAAIYGLEESAGRSFLVMELVPGETLARQIEKGPIPVEDALTVAAQIAGALEAAHEKGITHRDLKPANIKQTPDGTVKVLDFGLAKMSESATAVSASDSPTRTIGATQPGVIMGTAAYMSPEQARGKAVDKRADIWSFGVVLYELLTGQRLFTGEDISEVLAKVIRDEPNLDAIPNDVRPLLRRCLEKDPKKRQRDIGDVRIELEQALEARSSTSRIAAASVAQVTSGSRFWPLDLKKTTAFAVLFVILGAIGGVLVWRGALASPQGVVRLSVVIPPTIRAAQIQFALNDRTLVVAGFPRKPDGAEEARARIYTRKLDEYEFKAIPGTEGTDNIRVSPNGEWIAFTARDSEKSSQRQLRKVRADGSALPVDVDAWMDGWNWFVWADDNELFIMANFGRKLLRLPTGGGAATTIDIDPGFTTHFEANPIGWPVVVGNHGLFLSGSSWEPHRGYELDLWVIDTRTGKAHLLFDNAENAVYSPTGHIVFTRGASLLAAPFDAEKLERTGEVIALADGVRIDQPWEHGPFQISSGGALLYPPGGLVGTDRQLIVVDTTGNVKPFATDRRPLSLAPRASLDGKKAAVVIPNSRTQNWEIFIADVDRPGIWQFCPANMPCSQPVWSDDGQWLAYNRPVVQGTKDIGIYVQRADGSGSPRMVLKQSEGESAIGLSWTKDGSGLLVFKTKPGVGAGDIVLVETQDGGEKEPPKDLLATQWNENGARVSPDGQFLAFTSDESGAYQLYVAPFGADGNLGSRVMIPTGGVPRVFNGVGWAGDSRRLYYNKEPLKVMSVTIDTKPTLSASTPVLAYDLAKLRVNPNSWDILPDGSLLAIQRGQGEDEVTQYNIVLNWLNELRLRMAK
jgi:serine/threonine-protein kinase